ncbi:MAG: PBP1A family penicillin-binding protein [Candidatus Tectomicrobia bacterium]|nr:PBP1A family penicillin-binding protein [Candidatus Tectomicrobia bacterium]
MFFKKWVFFIFLFISIAVGSFTGLLMVFLKSLPQIKTLEDYRPNTVTKVFSDDDQLIGEFFLEKRILVPLSRVPKVLKDATLAVEDARFYEHAGIDYIGIGRALWKDIKAQKIVEGGSTITQQLAKLLFLTPERKIIRKIKEALLSIEIESVYTKDEILELYMNQVYFGSGAYGVEAAAQIYFGKHVEDLTLPDAALLAGLPRAPSSYSPFENPEKGKERRRLVLGRMLDQGFITQEEATKADLSPLNLVPSQRRVNLSPYFVEYLRRYLEGKYGTAAVHGEGLNIYTTLNLDMQRTAHTALRKGLRDVQKRRGFRPPARDKKEDELDHSPTSQFLNENLISGIVTQVDKNSLAVKFGRYEAKIGPKGIAWTKVTDPTLVFRIGDRITASVTKVPSGKGQDEKLEYIIEQQPDVEGALLAIEPQTGAIKVMIGGYDFFKSQFNRVMQAKRQPGSSFKVFTYLAAIDRGKAPTDIVVDAPLTFTDAKGRIWQPKNFTGKFLGPITYRKALEQSINVAAIKVMQNIGVKTVIDYAKKVGITSELAPYLPLAIGASDVTLMEMTSAFGVFANKGVRVDLNPIRYVTNASGEVLEKSLPVGYQVIRPETAFVLTHMLRGVIEHGTGTKAREVGRPVAGKTGTTNDFEDAWFIAYTPSLVTGVWVGMDDHTPIGHRETGGGVAAPIWTDFMKQALEGKPVEDFEVPPGVVIVNIDAETGFLASPQCRGRVIAEAFIMGTEPMRFCGGGVEASDGKPDASLIRAGETTPGANQGDSKQDGGW